MALRYLAKSAKSQDEVKQWGFEAWCPVRTKTGGTRPGMTGAKVLDDKWTDGVVPENPADKKKIIGKVLEIAVTKIFESNAYTFNGDIRIQENGSPIGLDLSGEIARLEMVDWDQEFSELCK